MSSKVEVYSNLEASMTRIHQAHWESGNEAHSKAAALTKKMMSHALKSKRTIYTTKIVNGVRHIVKSASHSMGDRIDHDTGRLMSTPNMANFIQFRTYSTTGTTVVGGLMKAGRTEVRRHGKIISTTPVFSVNQSSIDILEKISTGKTNKALWNTKEGGYSHESLSRFRGTHENNPTNFIAQGKRNAISAIKVRIPRWTLDAIKNRENIKQEPLKRKV